MATTVTIQQMLRRQVIIGLVQRLVTPANVLSSFYGMAPGMPAVKSFSGRELGWDLYDATRKTAKGRAPMTGPATSPRKIIGHVNAVAFRSHDSIMIMEEEVFQTRPLGGQIGTVDPRGRNYVTRQVRTLAQTFQNSREFMASRAFMGGFGVKISGDDHFLLEKSGSGYTFNVEMQIPANNLTQLDMGTGSNILTASWATAGTSIISHLMNVNAALMRISSRPLEHIWMNSSTYVRTIMQNTEIRTLGGSANTYFDIFGKRQIENQDGKQVFAGFAVVLKAVPWVMIHVYDGVLNVGDVADSTAASACTKIIPDDKAIFTPAPDPEWIGWVEGSEVIAENVMSAGREAKGFDSWSTRVIDPAGWQTKMIDNGLPAVFVPNAVCFPTVVF